MTTTCSSIVTLVPYSDWVSTRELRPSFSFSVIEETHRRGSAGLAIATSSIPGRLVPGATHDVATDTSTYFVAGGLTVIGRGAGFLAADAGGAAHMTVVVRASATTIVLNPRFMRVPSTDRLFVGQPIDVARASISDRQLLYVRFRTWCRPCERCATTRPDPGGAHRIAAEIVTTGLFVL